MASYSNITTGNAGLFAQIAARFVETREKAARALVRRRVFRQTMKELSALSRHELADLGLNPTIIRQVAWEEALKR